MQPYNRQTKSGRIVTHEQATQFRVDLTAWANGSRNLTVTDSSEIVTNLVLRTSELDNLCLTLDMADTSVVPHQHRPVYINLKEALVQKLENGFELRQQNGRVITFVK